MYDSMGCTKLLEKHVSPVTAYEKMSRQEFTNMVNDFFFHTVWASKKILRGELWTAKMCIDAYLKGYLLKIIEMYSVSKYDADVWHDGRFLDRWAEEEIKENLKKCFAHYDKEDLISALISTKELFGRLACETAEMNGFEYPKEAESYAGSLLTEYFQ